ncbi:MAG: hypothetical protein D6754_07785 [Alphaproteobacteria bacterium]|nr:MAG: hypothetical protein D6754_07785 [Alphaproteobacteria bacterium]
MIRALVNWIAIIASLVGLIAAGVWLYLEYRWADWAPVGTEAEQRKAAFVSGPIGLEVFPLKYAAVLEKLSGKAFKHHPDDSRSVWEIYGFLPNPKAKGEPVCEATAADELPFGFNITNYVPVRAIQTPVKFAGLTCAACHSGVIRTEKGASDIILGMGNPELDVIGFSEAVRNAILDPGLTGKAILEKYAEQCPDDGQGFLFDQVEAVLLDQWLKGLRAEIEAGVRQYGLPLWPHGAMPYAPDTPREALEPAGPGRTRPFRSVVRVALALPGAENYAFSKIPSVFEQRRDLRPRSQYDGSIKDPVVRAFIAAYASGASPVALAKPEVAHSIRYAAAFTERLGIDTPLPRIGDIFPDLPEPDPAALAEGLAAFKADCAGCHGYRDPQTGYWVAEGARLHDFVPVDEIGTDPERVRFPNGPYLPLALWTALPQAGKGLEHQRERLDQARNSAVARQRMGEALLWSQQRERLDRAAREFRLGHPLSFAECSGGNCNCAAEQPRPANAQPLGTAALDACALTAQLAYFNNPIPSVWLRAPYLHNGSVPTLRQLLNLEDRPDRFCRGRNRYDPQAVGLVAPAPKDGVCAEPTPFLFDTTQRGNSNRGHDYPYTRAEVLADPARAERLEKILLYMRGI